MCSVCTIGNTHNCNVQRKGVTDVIAAKCRARQLKSAQPVAGSAWTPTGSFIWRDIYNLCYGVHCKQRAHETLSINHLDESCCSSMDQLLVSLMH